MNCDEMLRLVGSDGDEVVRMGEGDVLYQITLSPEEDTGGKVDEERDCLL